MDKKSRTQTLNQHEKQIDQYVFNFRQGKLGRGQYGTVYKGLNVMTNEEVAIKIIRKSDIQDQDDLRQLLSEIQIMQRLKCKNIVRIYDVLHSDNNYYLIMEYCNAGDLDKILYKTNTITSADHYTFLVDVLTAFIQLIMNGIIHRDLKPANILVSKNNSGEYVYKLGDFGFARSLKNHGRQMLDSKVGTPLYMSPQLLDEQNYTSKSDIWSLAFITYQIIYLKTPWTGKTEDELLYRIINTPLQFPDKPKISDMAKDFLQGCLMIEEKDRFSWDQLYRHPYVAANFVNYIEQSKSIERKVNYLLASLREKASAIDVEKLFKELDTSGDYALNLQEFAQLMWKIDSELDMKEISLVFDEIDHDGNGDIDMNEFKKALQLSQGQIKFVIPVFDPKVNQTLVKLNRAIQKYNINLFNLFQKYDTSGNGSLDRSELQELLEKIDSNLNRQEIEEALNVFDENGDGEVQFNEFRRVFDNIEKERIMKECLAKPLQKNEIRSYFDTQSLRSKKSILEYEVDDGGSMIQEPQIEPTSIVPIKQNNGITIIPMMIRRKE